MPAAYRMLTASTPEALEQVVNDYLASRTAARLLAFDVAAVSDFDALDDVFVAYVTTDTAEAHPLAQPYSVRLLVRSTPHEAAEAFNAFADANPNAWIAEQKVRTARYSYPREGRQQACIAVFAYHPVAADGEKNWRPVPKSPGQGGGGGSGSAPKAATPKP